MKKRRNKKMYFTTQASNISLFSKVILIILVIGMMICSLNISAVVKAIQPEEHITITDDIDRDFSNFKNISEVDELRTENSKTYLKENGMYETEYYNEKIHYNINNKWEEIDNTLKIKNNRYYNNKNRFNVSFPNKLNKNNKIYLNYLNKEIKIYYDTNDDKIATLNNQINRDIINLKDEITYQLSNQEQIQYIIKQDSIKESIILNSYKSNYQYDYYIETALRLEEIGNQIYFFDGNEAIYILNEYYMYDANNNISKDIEYEIVVINNNTYKIKVTPSDNYLRQATYPVVIDPEISIMDGGYLGGLFNVTTLDMSDNTILSRSIGEFTINNRTKTNSNDDIKAFFNVTIPYEYTIGNMYDTIGKNQFMYATISLPTTNTNTSSNTEVVLKEISKKNTSTSIDYTDSTTYNSSYIDSEFFHSTNVFDHTFDVYEIIKTKLNYLKTTDISFCFELSINQGNNNSTVTYSLGGDLVGEKPVLKLGYLSDAGLASYYTYESFPVSKEANVYVAHNSGNLTLLFNDYTDNSLLSLSHIFNENRKEVNTFYGNGYSINYNEYIKPINSNSRYLLTKGDGREVIFSYQSNNKYIANDGSGETLTTLLDTSSNIKGYEIENSSGGLNVYDNNGKLSKIYTNIKDRENGVWGASTKYITLEYNTSNQLIKVIDSIGNYILLRYNTSALLDLVQVYKYNPEANTTNFAYELYYEYIENDLIYISKYLDGVLVTSLNLQYNSKNSITKIYKDYNGYTFTYDNQNRVTEAKVYSSLYTNGDYITFSYNTNGKKTILSNGLNEKTSYTFDDYYHTISVEDNNGFTTFYKYEDIYYNENNEVVTNPNYNKNHKIKVQSNSFKNTINPIDNHGFEIGSGSTINGWTKQLTGSSSATISTASILYGSRVLKLYKSSNGQAIVYQDIEVENGEEYIVSGYIKNTNTTGNGAYILVNGIDGTISTIQKSTSVLSTKDFIRYEYKFKANYTGKVRISLVNESTGNVYFDNIQLNTSYLDTRYNYLNNSSFESSTLIGWTGYDFILEDRLVTNYAGTNINYEYFNENCGNQNLKLATGGYVTQTINVTGLEGDILVFGGYCLYENYTGNVTVKLTLETDNGTISKQFTYDGNDINANYYMEKFAAPSDYYSVTIKISNNSNSSFANIDNFAIYKEGYGINITYNDDGNITSEYNEVTQDTVTYQYYSGTNNIKSITTEEDVTNIAYNNKNYVTNVETNNVTTSFELNDDGNIISTTITASSSENQYFSGSTSYTSDGLYPKTQTDIHNSVITNTYDYITGLITNINTKNNDIDINDSYTYDKKGNIISETKSSSNISKTITYQYDYDNRLTKIIDGACIYTLTYNKYGDLKTIKIGSIELVKHNYTNENTASIYNSEVSSSEYNYGTVYFDYNDLHQVEKIYHNTKTSSGLVLEYMYNDYGEISSYTDYLENVTYYFNYDYQNRLININASNGNNFTFTYDDNSNLISKGNINGTNHYIYSDDKIIREEINSFYYKTYTYSNDSFEQLQTINYYIDIMGDVPTIQNNFVYDTKEISDDTTYTGLIKEAIYVVGDDTIKFIYEYDIFDNITKIIKYVNNVIEYTEENTYDLFSQLTKQLITSNNNSFSISYQYDTRGNIEEITKRNAITNETISIISLTYNNNNDLIQINDNGTIYENAYNTQGMLTKYLNYNITYDMRNISTLQKDNELIEYKYNSDGIRISKVINNEVTINYTLDGTNIIKETRNGSTNSTIKYYYDSSDNVIGFSYNSYHYMYLKNTQNDVIGIIDSNGNLVVEYKYDAYGNIYEMIDNTNISIGTINPFRYRSYYFDTETGWYYLNTRYYNPKLARFITIDDIDYLGASGSLLSYNLYSYCENNPVNNVDVTGNSIVSIISGAVLGGITSAIMYYLEYLLGMRDFSWVHFIVYVGLGVALGAVGAWVKDIIKVAKLSKLASKLKVSIPIIKKVLNLGVTGIKFVINGFAKKLTRKKDESWAVAIKRLFT